MLKNRLKSKVEKFPRKYKKKIQNIYIYKVDEEIRNQYQNRGLLERQRTKKQLEREMIPQTLV